MRSFASDNNSSVHPDIMDAIIKANDNHAIGYGSDKWTTEAEAAIKNVFGDTADPYFVFNGTGANCVALQAITRPFNSILCASTAHISQDECGAPGKMTGCAIVSIPAQDGKLTPELIMPHLKNFGFVHHSQPKAVYISQTTEMGTVYTIDEIRAIADLAHSFNMYLHVDGARLANACAYLGCSLKEITVDAGVDILSFGGTKNGMMMGEAVISFNKDLSENLGYIRKQSAQLASKLRYMSAQFPAYLNNNLWLENATKANIQAMKIAGLLSKFPEIKFTQKVESNQLFFIAPKEITAKLLKDYYFYIWNEITGEARIVTSWDTTDKDIEEFENTLYK